MTNEVQIGKNIDYLASLLVSATTYNGGATGLVASGDAVSIGDLVGVSASTALDSTDLIDVQHTGVFNLPVVGYTGSANAAIAVGARLYIDGVTGVINTNSAKTFYGWALAAVGSGATTIIPVRLKH